MTIASTDNKIQYDCDGEATGFDFLFPIMQTSDLKVWHTDALGADTLLEETTDYTVEPAGEDYSGGGTVTLNEIYDDGEMITIVREVPLTQEADFAETGTFSMETVEKTYDRLVMMIQQLNARADRALSVPESELSIDYVPSVINRALKLLGFDATGKPAVFSPEMYISDAVLQSALSIALAAAASAAASAAGIQAFIDSNAYMEQAAIDAAREYANILRQALIDGEITETEQISIDAAKAYADIVRQALIDGEITDAEQAAIDAAAAYADILREGLIVTLPVKSVIIGIAGKPSVLIASITGTGTVATAVLSSGENRTGLIVGDTIIIKNSAHHDGEYIISGGDSTSITWLSNITDSDTALAECMLYYKQTITGAQVQAIIEAQPRLLAYNSLSFVFCDGFYNINSLNFRGFTQGLKFELKGNQLDFEIERVSKRVRIDGTHLGPVIEVSSVFASTAISCLEVHNLIVPDNNYQVSCLLCQNCGYLWVASMAAVLSSEFGYGYLYYSCASYNYMNAVSGGYLGFYPIVGSMTIHECWSNELNPPVYGLQADCPVQHGDGALPIGRDGNMTPDGTGIYTRGGGIDEQSLIGYQTDISSQIVLYQNRQAKRANLSDVFLNQGVPTGTVIDTYAPSIHGWYLLNGGECPRSSGLFAIFGTTHGIGDGSTTFNLPVDLLDEEFYPAQVGLISNGEWAYADIRYKDSASRCDIAVTSQGACAIYIPAELRAGTLSVALTSVSSMPEAIGFNSAYGIVQNNDGYTWYNFSGGVTTLWDCRQVGSDNIGNPQRIPNPYIAGNVYSDDFVLTNDANHAWFGVWGNEGNPWHAFLTLSITLAGVVYNYMVAPGVNLFRSCGYNSYTGGVYNSGSWVKKETKYRLIKG